MSLRKTALTIGMLLSVCGASAQPGVPWLPPEFDGTSFVIAPTGELYGWGNNQFGQLGNGQAGGTVAAPTLVPKPAGVRTWKAVSDGWMSGAIADDGNLYLWGSTNCGSSGPFALSPILMPKPATVTRWLKVAAGDASCAPLTLGDDGNLYHHGFRGFHSPMMVPRPEGVSGWLKISGARSYHVALANNGEIYNWRPPNLESITLNKLARPAGVNRWVDLSSGMHLELALGDNGEVYQQSYYWPPQQHRLVTRPANVKSWKSVSAGSNFSTAVGDDDRLYVWGTTQPIPVSFPLGVRKWVSVSAGSSAVLMVGDDLRVYTWDMSTTNTVGTGTNISYLRLPVPVKGLPQTDPPTIELEPIKPIFPGEVGFRFWVRGSATTPSVLFRSSNLQDWTPILTNAPLNGGRSVMDTNVVGSDRLFYKVGSP